MSYPAMYDAAKTALAQSNAINEVIPKSAGVYAFYRGSDCMYVGESKNIRHRIATHERKKQLIGCEVRFFVCDDRKSIERQLICDLKPTRNGRSPAYEQMLNRSNDRWSGIPIDERFGSMWESIFGDSPFSRRHGQ